MRSIVFTDLYPVGFLIITQVRRPCCARSLYSSPHSCETRSMTEYRTKRYITTPRISASARLSREEVRLPRPLSARFHFISSHSSTSADPMSALLTARRNYVPPRTAPAACENLFSSSLVVQLPDRVFLQQTRALSRTPSVDAGVQPGSEHGSPTPQPIEIQTAPPTQAGPAPPAPPSTTRTPRPFFPPAPPERSRAALAAEAACFQSKPEPHWMDLFQEARRDLAADAFRQQAFLSRMRSYSGRQISAARLAFNVARHPPLDRAGSGATPLIDQ